LPGWNRLSAGLHSDDLAKFYEDPNGGADYISHHPQFSYLASRGLRAGDVWGCGYEFAGGSLFYTHNGVRLPNAFSGLYVPRQAHDVYAAIGVEGRNEFEINFGGDRFAWKEGNEWAWRVEGHVGRMETRLAPGSSNSGFAGPFPAEDLPSYVESQ
jgi:Ran-binding protein 9/10